MRKLTLSMANAIRREFRAFPKETITARINNLSSKYDISLRHTHRIIKKQAWKASTLRNPQYELFKKHIECTSPTKWTFGEQMAFRW